jgi:predicted metal-dependent HD superfamily phosphohydrolase
MQNSQSILEKAEDFIFQYYQDHFPDNLVFHSYNHIVETVEAVALIGEGNNLLPEQIEMVQLAAWFHDSGYAEDRETHEEKSAEIASAFLSKLDYPSDNIKVIRNIILATRMPQEPKTLLEQVMCDGDLIHVGKKSFTKRSDMLRAELEITQGKSYSDVEWVQNEIDFLSGHKYHTPFANIEFSNRKANNIAQLHEQLKTLKKEKKLLKKKEDTQLEKKRRKELLPERGVETMFRVTYRVHMELSGMADNKANILITINALVLSIIFTNMVPKLGDSAYLAIPTGIIILVCLGTIIFSTLSTRPKITSGTFTLEDVSKKRVNLLFFGNFYKVGLEDFEIGMQAMMRDREFLYGSMTKDIYFLGKVLAKKYKLIRIAYNIFMYGLILSALSYGLAFYFFTLNTP